MVVCSRPHADKIVLFGMSCVGKTTFARQLTDHRYYCFDALFQWHEIEGLGLSISGNLSHVQKQCDAGRFVIDGWHLADKGGQFLPNDTAVYAICAPYSQILKQYRVQVTDRSEYWQMFLRWYNDVDYSHFKEVRYFFNEGDFVEVGQADFTVWLEHSLRTGVTSEIPGSPSSLCSP